MNQTETVPEVDDRLTLVDADSPYEIGHGPGTITVYDTRDNEVVAAFEVRAYETPAIDRETAKRLAQSAAMSDRYARNSAAIRERRRLTLPKTVAGTSIEVGEIILDTRSRVVTVAGYVVSLTKREFDLLYALMVEPNRVMTRAELYAAAWAAAGLDPMNVSSRSLDAHIGRLRSKLNTHSTEKYIDNVWGVGYCLRRPLPDRRRS